MGAAAEYAGAFVVDARSVGIALAPQERPEGGGNASDWRMRNVVVVSVGREPLHSGRNVRRLVNRAAEDACGRVDRERREDDE
jgi:hypothetical protein